MAIVVGYIPTAQGRAALDHAQREAVNRKLKLIVVRSHQGGATVDAQDVRRFEDQLAEVRHRLDREGVDNEVRSMVRGKSPAEDLVEVANSENAEYIVIGLRRRSLVGKLVLGSNAQEILIDADCPVIAVKAEK